MTNRSGYQGPEEGKEKGLRGFWSTKAISALSTIFLQSPNGCCSAFDPLPFVSNHPQSMQLIQLSLPTMDLVQLHLPRSFYGYQDKKENAEVARRTIKPHSTTELSNEFIANLSLTVN